MLCKRPFSVKQSSQERSANLWRFVVYRLVDASLRRSPSQHRKLICQLAYQLGTVDLQSLASVNIALQLEYANLAIGGFKQLFIKFQPIEAFIRDGKIGAVVLRLGRNPQMAIAEQDPY